MLLQFLENLDTPILSNELLSCWSNGLDPCQIQQYGRAILHGLKGVHYNTFIYLISFLREVLKHRGMNKSSSSELAFLFRTSFSHTDKDRCSQEDVVHRLLMHFLTTHSL